MSFQSVSPEEFLANIKKRSGGHWEWVGPMTTGGVPYLKVGSQLIRAYRVAWWLFRGELPQGMTLRKTCDHVGCVSPHCREAVPTGEHTRGSRHGRARLTEQDVIDIRERHENSQTTQKELAAEYGVSQPLISQIVTGKAWGHVK